MARERKLTHEERILWLKVARSAKPLPGRVDDEAFDEALQHDLAAEISEPPARRQQQTKPASAQASPAPAAKPAPGLNPIERPVKR
ncbi:MAG TPA: DNA mismatch repair protein MutS, partial [Pararhizobium sp.]|nr:DNA mismatch repair protein MutS [Pararhizobium sp.]